MMGVGRKREQTTEAIAHCLHVEQVVPWSYQLKTHVKLVTIAR